jgi:ferredoxin
MHAFFREGKKVQGYRWTDFVHGYIYSRFVYPYIAIGTGHHPLSKLIFPIAQFITRISSLIRPQQNDSDSVQFADTYHGKVVPLDAAKQLVSVKEDIRLENLEKVVPYKLARDIILQEPQHLGVLDCPCRSAREHPCLPLDVCIIVGEPFVGMMTEITDKRFRKISQMDALQILEEEDQRGHVHHAFFKDAMLGRFYAICNCCSCCCGAMQSQKAGSNMLASSGYLAVVDKDNCIGCGICEQACQFEAITMQDGISQISYALCMGCGNCVNQCSQTAISLNRDTAKGIPLELDELLEEYQAGSVH